jgi:hypothetical protein
MTNFYQFDPSKNNMQSDAAYSSSSFRSQGAQTGVASSSAHNKLFYQLSTMVAALAQMMEAKGYTMEDTSIATLVTELSNIMTEVDMADYASQAQLAGYIQKQAVIIKTISYVISPTDFYKTLEANSATALTFTLPLYTSVASGAWIKIKNIGAGILSISGTVDGEDPIYLDQWEEITIFSDGTAFRGKIISTASSLSFDASLTTNGYQKLPSGLIVQWGQYSSSITSETSISVSFPVAFPNTCLNVQATGINSAGANNRDLWPQVVSFTTNIATIFCQGGGNTDRLDGVYWFAVGY